MTKKDFDLKKNEKKISKEIDKNVSDKLFNYINKNNSSLNQAITLLSKLSGLHDSLLNAEFKVDSKGKVKTKNLPKLIETFFELLNEGNIYYLEQTKINQIVKYLNGKLILIKPEAFFDKKILKRIFYNIQKSKIKFSHSYDVYDEFVDYRITLNIITEKTKEKKEEIFDVSFCKKISFADDFESSKWYFGVWTLNELVTELKACIKWLKTNK